MQKIVSDRSFLDVIVARSRSTPVHDAHRPRSILLYRNQHGTRHRRAVRSRNTTRSKPQIKAQLTHYLPTDAEATI